MDFGTVLKRSRRRRAQADLARQVVETAKSSGLTDIEFSGSTWSRWENNQYLPDRSDERLPPLASVLAVPLEALHDALTVSISGDICPYQPQLSGEFFDEAQTLVTRFTPQNTEIFLLGPETLPVLDNPSVRMLWTHNLARGTDYHIIWLCEHSDPEIIVKLGRVLAEVDQQVDDAVKGEAKQQSVQPGMIANYLIRLTEGEAERATKVEQLDQQQVRVNFDVLCAMRLQHVRFELPKSIEAELVHSMMLHFDAYTTIALYTDRTGCCKPEASLCLREVRRNLPQTPMTEPVFFWLSNDRAAAIQKIMNDFRKQYGAKVKASPRHNPNGKTQGAR